MTGNGTPFPLAYTEPPPFYKRRKVRRYALAFIVTLCVAGAWKATPSMIAQWRLLDAQRACLNYNAPPDTIAYFEGDTASLGKLFMSEPTYVLRAELFSGVPNFAVRTVPQWDRLQTLAWGDRSWGSSSMFGGGGGPPPPPPPKSQRIIDALKAVGSRSAPAIAFLHRRVSPGGHARLVVVELQRVSLRSVRWEFDATAHEYGMMGSLAQAAQVQRLDVDFFINEESRYFTTPCCLFGQPDALDASKFAIEYEFDGQLGMIDGQLLDDDRVVLSVRSGPASRPNTSHAPDPNAGALILDR